MAATDRTSSGKEMRRAADELSISGLAVLALGVWTSFKFFTRAFIERHRVYEDALKAGENVRHAYLLFFTIVFIVAFLLMALHLYIGFAAAADAAGARIRPPYRVVSFLMLIVTADSGIRNAAGFLAEGNAQSETASFIIDLTLVFALFNLIRSSRKLKKLRRALSEQDAEQAGPSA